MRHFAITGIVTTALMPSIIAGSLMRATPPSRRMSAGTRSSAIGDLRLLGVDDIHDDATAQHLGQTALDPNGSGRALLRHHITSFGVRFRVIVSPAPSRPDPRSRLVLLAVSVLTGH